MSFPKQDPRVFSRQRIERLTPDQKGCYGIFRDGVWIYIGEGDIRQRLLDHLLGDNQCIAKQNPTHWVAEVTDDPDTREKELIFEHNPVCNQRVG